MYYCKACGQLDEKHGARAHRCAINTKPAINRAINSNAKAIVQSAHAPVQEAVVDAAVQDLPQEHGSVRSRKAGTSDRAPNRRDRDAYNAYMREYMRKRRAGESPAD